MEDQYTLYHYDSCPFCAMVRRFLDGRGIDLPKRNIQRDPDARAELIAGGGRPTVPCLKIVSSEGQERWMYESMDIMRYLDEKFVSE